MTYSNLLARSALAGTALLGAAMAVAQEAPQDHSCTVSAAATSISPYGLDGDNFHHGWGIEAGAGFAVTEQANLTKSPVLFLTADFLYGRMKPEEQLFTQAQSDPQFKDATSAHAAFTALTFDPTVRFPRGERTSFYLTGGFGWLRRGVSFVGNDVQPLLDPGGPSSGSATLNSGVLDAGAGVNFGLKKRGGLMLYVEVRAYRGLAVNNGDTLLPVSVGVRW